MIAALLINALLLGGCGGKRAAPPSGDLLFDCLITDPPAEEIDGITVALLGPVKPSHAPVPRSYSERIVFSQIYQSLFYLDCNGERVPALASSWERKADGRAWIFRLRRSARFSDGTPLKPEDIISCWNDPGRREIMKEAGIEKVAVEGKDQIAVYFSGPQEELPAILSLPEFAVTRRADYSPWPLGTGPYRAVTMEPGFARNRSRKTVAHPSRRGDRPSIEFIETSTAGVRDLFEENIDMLVTSDPAVIEYASGRIALTPIPLPFDRVYVLVSSTRAGMYRWGETLPPLPGTFLDNLARDAVRSDARGHRRPCWLDEPGICMEEVSEGRLPPLAIKGADPSSIYRRVVYDEDDPIARALAERIVALAVADSARSSDAATLAMAVPGIDRKDVSTSAEGLSGLEMTKSFEQGGDFAYIISFPLRPVDRCIELRRIVSTVPWLSSLGEDLPAAILPLIDTRRHLIVDKARVGIEVDWTGNLLIFAGE